MMSRIELSAKLKEINLLVKEGQVNKAVEELCSILLDLYDTVYEMRQSDNNEERD